MTPGKEFRIAVFPGDGIGPEVISPCLDLLDALASTVGGFHFRFEQLEAGADLYSRTGVSFSEDAFRRAQTADAVLLGAMGLPDVRYPDGTEISPQLDLRERLHLYAGVRPVKTVPGVPLPLADPRARDIDIVIVRESTEGLFAARGKTDNHDNETARDTLQITRDVSERLFDFAFQLALGRKRDGHPGRVTCVDKANVLGSYAFFRKIFNERAVNYTGIQADASYVDAMGLNLIMQPWAFDVLVTENLLGDILSDVGAALMGGMGMAPSADIGESNAVFQPCHGSAPDIVGTGKANPTATFLSASMMLDWLGKRHRVESCRTASRALACAIESAFADGSRVPHEMGGNAGTNDIANAIMQSVTEDRVHEIAEAGETS
jgi:3-isopropylmalate dehydrogenase